MDFTTNYCGAYWSDGTFQSSVADGKSTPVSALDAACQEHDRSYALSKDLADLDAADNKFFDNVRSLGLRGYVYGNAVKHVNRLTRHTMPSWYNAIKDKFYVNQVRDVLDDKRNRDRAKLNLRVVETDGATRPVTTAGTETLSRDPPIVYGPVAPLGSEEATGHAWGFSSVSPMYSVHNWPKQKQQLKKNRVVPYHPLKQKTKTKPLTNAQKLECLPHIFPPRNKPQDKKKQLPRS